MDYFISLKNWNLINDYFLVTIWKIAIGKKDVALEQDLRDYVGRNLKRKEILHFMKRDYE